MKKLWNILINRRQGTQNVAGFTLIELIVVLAVMGVLLSVLVPPLIQYRMEAVEKERHANEDALNKAIRQCYALEGRYPPAMGETGLDYLTEHYGVVVKPDLYRYHYEVLNGAPRLSVEHLQE